MTTMTISSILSEVADRYHLRRKSGKWVGACPECGGSNTSDKFNMRDDGGFKCYSCEFRGDIITWLRRKEGLSCPAAHERAGKDCQVDCCQVRDKCRLGGGKNGKGGSRRYQLSSVRPREHRQAQALPVSSVTAPPPAWQAWACTMVAKGRENILQQPDVLQWLASRGLDLSAVKRFGLGWLAHSYQVKRATIGISPVKDGKDKLWVPDGLLIPIYDRSGQLHRLRVRRSQEARARFLPDLKYVWLEGSGTGPLVIRPEGRYRGAVVAEAELDAFAVADAHDQVMVIGIGTVSAGLPARFMAELHESPVILVALDADPGKDGKPGPGPKAFQMWQAGYRQARFFPVPSGKDAGDYAGRGGDLRLWIESGLPPVVLQAGPSSLPSGHEQPFSPESSQGGGRGDVSPLVDASQPMVGNELKTAVENGFSEVDDPIVDAINVLPELERNEAMSFYRIMQGHPVTGWLSPDGDAAGIIDVQGDWRENNRDLSDRFAKLFYGPAHGALCRIFRELFVRNARVFGKCAFGKETV